jgi:hypothetical protein
MAAEKAKVFMVGCLVREEEQGGLVVAEMIEAGSLVQRD